MFLQKEIVCEFCHSKNYLINKYYEECVMLTTILINLTYLFLWIDENNLLT